MAEAVASSGARGARRRKLNVMLWLPIAWIAFVFGCALSADWWPMPEPDYMDFLSQGAPPGTTGEVPIGAFESSEGLEHYVFWLGTDMMGRDIVSRLMFGARVSLTLGLLAPLIGLVIGGGLGMAAGYWRGMLEATAVGVTDTILAFPGIVLLLAIVFYLGGSLLNLTLALGFLTVPAFYRVARANTLTYAEREFVTAAKAMGASDVSILAREILPNVIMPMLVYALLIVALLIVVEGVLSFLGLSVPTAPSWGGMIAEGREYLDEHPRLCFVPAFVMFLTVLSFNLLGDRLRGLTDVRESNI
ncbi:MAG: ABC transporter permease [Alphaproteobacteria bacterium]|nr:ABC transporter permease [Alphaproteobacteria bacterium]